MPLPTAQSAFTYKVQSRWCVCCGMTLLLIQVWAGQAFC